MSTLERVMVNLSTAIVGLSGVVYGCMKYLLSANDPFSVVNHPLQPWVLDIHVLAAPFMIFAVGLIAREHIFSKFRKGSNGRRGRATGLVVVICLLPMISTGYLIQVFTNEQARLACVILHLVTGVVYFAFFVAHLVIARRIAALKRAAEQAAGTQPAWTHQHLRRRTERRPARGAL